MFPNNRRNLYCCILTYPYSLQLTLQFALSNCEAFFAVLAFAAAIIVFSLSYSSVCLFVCFFLNHILQFSHHYYILLSASKAQKIAVIIKSTWISRDISWWALTDVTWCRLMCTYRYRVISRRVVWCALTDITWYHVVSADVHLLISRDITSCRVMCTYRYHVISRRVVSRIDLVLFKCVSRLSFLVCLLYGVCVFT
jgi:hypothetical protein